MTRTFRTQLITWLGASLLVPTLSHALTVGRLDVRSSLGEPFVAELMVSDLGDINPSDLQISLANAQDFQQFGISRNAYTDSLHFSARSIDGQRASISIRGNLPVSDPFLDVVIKIKAGPNTRLQHLSALIDPPRLQPTTITPVPAVTSVISAPELTARANKLGSTLQDKPLIPILSDPPPLVAPDTSEVVAPAMSVEERAQAPRYVVQKNDSLWKIAARLAPELKQSAGNVMKQIQQLNQHAFIHGNPNQIKHGAELILPQQHKTQPVSQNLTVNEQAIPSPASTKPVSKPSVSPSILPNLKRGRLPKAEMTLIAPSTTGIAQGNSTQQGRTTGAQPLSRDLALRVGNARQKTVSLRREVVELDAKVAANDQKIAIQNAKLAELEQRLKARKEAQRKARAKLSTLPALAFTALLLMGTGMFGTQPAYAGQYQQLEDQVV